MTMILTTRCPECGETDASPLRNDNVVASTVSDITDEHHKGLRVAEETAVVRIDEGDGALGCECESQREEVYLRVD